MPAAEPAKSEEAKPAEEQAKPAEEAVKPVEPAPDKPEEPSFTADQDATLLKSKGENMSWKAISILMDGKPVYQLKNRFKELKTAESAEKKAAEEKEAAEKAKKEAAKTAKEAKSKEKREKKHKKEKKEAEKSEGTEQVTETVKEKVVYVRGTDKFTKDEVSLDPCV